MADLFKSVTTQNALWAAWRHVRSRGRDSDSDDIRAQVEVFDREPMRYLRAMQHALRSERFVFAPQIGVPKKKPKKDSVRPLIVAPLENRIVQRALLEGLTTVPAIQGVLDTPTSFGARRKRGVDCAISLAVDTIRGGAVWYARSDIQGFFTKIPKSTVSAFVHRATANRRFARLFDAAMAVELENAAALGEDVAHFPTGDIGVAQGSSLSPLVGNILLKDLDALLNSRGIVCIRYIDDFLLLGTSKQNVAKAFQSAQEHLARFEMEAYDPASRSDKASFGQTAEGFDFLGCRVQPGLIQPSPKARAALKDGVRDLLKKGRTAMRRAKSGDLGAAQRYVQTLVTLDLKLRGWVDAYYFCNGQQCLAALDGWIDDQLSMFDREAHRLLADGSQVESRRVLGVRCLIDRHQEKHRDLPRCDSNATAKDLAST